MLVVRKKSYKLALMRWHKILVIRNYYNRYDCIDDLSYAIFNNSNKKNLSESFFNEQLHFPFI